MAHLWNLIKEILLGLGVVAGGLGAITVILELAFKPIRKFKDKRIKREERSKRIEESLDRLDDHLVETEDHEARMRDIEKIVLEHEREIEASKAERRLTWKAQRATLDGLRQLNTNGMVTQTIKEMDDFSNDHMNR